MSHIRSTIEHASTEDLIQNLRDTAEKAFITCISGDGNPRVTAEFRNLKECQEFYAALLFVLIKSQGIAKPTEPSEPHGQEDSPKPSSPNSSVSLYQHSIVPSTDQHGRTSSHSGN